MKRTLILIMASLFGGYAIISNLPDTLCAVSEIGDTLLVVKDVGIISVTDKANGDIYTLVRD